MCGIAGIWRWNGAPIGEEEIASFTYSLHHRGPDGQGIYIDPADCSLALGHRRLAIIDLSPTGRQPMSYAGERYWLTYNGEIYNFVELRRELEALGCQFVSQSDSEVILAAYHWWGPACQQKFNGMWAFCILDSERNRIFCARDRAGIRGWHARGKRTSAGFAESLLGGRVGRGVIASTSADLGPARAIHGHFDLAKTAVHFLNDGRIRNGVLIAQLVRHL